MRELEIRFTKYGREEYKNSGLSFHELEESIRKTALENPDYIGYILCEPVDHAEKRFRPDGTFIVNTSDTVVFILKGIREYKIESGTCIPRYEGKTLKEYLKTIIKSNIVTGIDYVPA